MGKLLKDPALYEDTRAVIADLRETLRLVNQGDGTVGKLMTTSTLHDRLEGTMTRLDTVLDKISSGEGTVAQLLNNPSLYESLDGTTREVQGFMKDFRANPKKFLTIQLKLF
jgi:phospholipid/cholesterol/gamma-HCH transport system substrate-binding protein